VSSSAGARFCAARLSGHAMTGLTSGRRFWPSPRQPRCRQVHPSDRWLCVPASRRVCLDTGSLCGAMPDKAMTKTRVLRRYRSLQAPVLT
jgi:hypothetical protein